MQILAPEIIGPLSACSTTLRVRGNISGATITVLVNGVETASHLSSSSDGVYAIGAAINANDVLTVRQILGNDSSPDSLSVTTQAVPAQLSALTLQTMMYQCGRRVYATGGVPGATIEGSIGSNVVGTGDVVSGEAAFTFDPVLGVGQKLTLKQTTCNSLSQSQNTPSAVAQPSPLSKPVIQEPLIECMTSITIGGVTDGAFVELYRNGVLEKTFTFAISQEWRRIKALKKDDLIEVRQGFKCKKESPQLESFSGKASAVVQGVDALNAPKFVGKPCPGTTHLTLANLIPGARVVLTLDDKELGQTDAAGSTQIFQVPPLPAGGVVKAFMMLCKKNGPTDSVTVSSGTQLPSDAKVSDLFQCAAYVFVKVFGNSGNYLAFITNKAGQHISAYHNLVGFEKLIPVSPSLVAGDEITLNIQGCGGTWQTFGPFAVSAGTPPQASFEEPIEAGTTSVIVKSLHAGARIDVFVNNAWAGSTISKGNLGITAVTVPTPLKTGDSVFATQTLCGRTGKPSKVVKVKKAKPLQPALVKPTNGAQGVDTQPLFEWSDPGANLENAAESYRVLVKQGSTTVLDTTVNNPPQLQSPAVLQYETDYAWTVQSGNSTGKSPVSSSFSFRTKAAPPPKKADLHFNPPITSSPAGFPRNTSMALQLGVVNSGNAPSGDFTVAFALSLHSNGDPIDYVEETFPSLDGGESILILSLPTEIYTDANVRIDAYLTVNGSQIDYAFRIV